MPAMIVRLLYSLVVLDPGYRILVIAILAASPLKVPEVSQIALVPHNRFVPHRTLVPITPDVPRRTLVPPQNIAAPHAVI